MEGLEKRLGWVRQITAKQATKLDESGSLSSMPILIPPNFVTCRNQNYNLGIHH